MPRPVEIQETEPGRTKFRIAAHVRQIRVLVIHMAEQHGGSRRFGVFVSTKHLVGTGFSQRGVVRSEDVKLRSNFPVSRMERKHTHGNTMFPRQRQQLLLLNGRAGA